MFVGLLPIFMFLRVLIILHQPHPSPLQAFRRGGEGIGFGLQISMHFVLKI